MNNKFCKGCIHRKLFSHKDAECSHSDFVCKKESFRETRVVRQKCSKARMLVMGFCGPEGKYFNSGAVL